MERDRLGIKWMVVMMKNGRGLREKVEHSKLFYAALVSAPNPVHAQLRGAEWPIAAGKKLDADDAKTQVRRRAQRETRRAREILVEACARLSAACIALPVKKDAEEAHSRAFLAGRDSCGGERAQMRSLHFARPDRSPRPVREAPA